MQERLVTIVQMTTFGYPVRLRALEVVNMVKSLDGCHTLSTSN